MPQLSRSQLAVYGAIAVVLLLVGARWIRSGEGRGEPQGGVSFASRSSDVTGGEGSDVVVHVAGEVNHPGVYRLPAGSRVTDGVRRAGGATARAATDGINLAARLSDGQQVIVPARTPAVGGGTATAGASTAASAAADGPISLGSATLEELDTIDGIGPVTAQDILDYRDQHGGISSIDELNRVSGIGPATMESLRARLQP